jgi:predicted DNA-binding transcriptional regulator AlpA
MAREQKVPTHLGRLLSDSELAQYVGKPTKTLANWRSLRIGPAYVRVGNTIRYREVDVDRWLDANTVATGGDAA